MKVNTTRFGELQVNSEDFISFKDGLLGFENLKNFFVVDPGDSTLILWLQSIDDSSIAFPIIEPKIFKPDYVAKLLPTDMNSVELEAITDAKIYSILTIPADITTMSANCKSPKRSTGCCAIQIVWQTSAHNAYRGSSSSSIRRPA